MQGLFSEHWHSVRRLRPKLRDSIRVYHRGLRKRHWILLYDPATHRFHRLTPEAYGIVCLMNGRRNLDEIWEAAVLAQERHGGSGHLISQQELVQLLGQLHSADLLQTQDAPNADEVHERFQRQQRARIRQSLLNPLSIKLPLFSPERILQKHTALARALTQPLVLVIWLVTVLPAVVIAAMRWNELTNNIADHVLSADNLLLAWCTYPIVKGLHESAHALAVKAWGGEVREVGLMFVVFTPVPYVDATASYGFTSKWRRALVAAAGILAELFIGALAVYLWSTSEPGWVHAVAFNTIMIAGVSTVLVNGNPLMRYDGYFVLTDLIEIPNLAQRAAQYWTYLIDRYAFGATDAEPPIGAGDERWWLIIYGAAAAIYRIVISIGVAWFVASKYFFIGVIFALAGLWASVVMPVWRGWQHLRTAPSLSTKRSQARKRTLIAVATAFFLLGVVPMPFYVVTQAVTRLPEEAYVRARVDGRVASLNIGAGQWVDKGQQIAMLDNLQVISEADRTAAVVDELSAQLRMEESTDLVKAAATRERLSAETARMEEARRKRDDLKVVARTGGQFVVTTGNDLVGQYFHRGDVIGYIVGDTPHLLYANIPQDDAWLAGQMTRRVAVRLERDVGHQRIASMVRRVPEGTDELFSSALGTQGGGVIPVDPGQHEGTKALSRVFGLELQFEEPVDMQIFGDRAYIRFDLGWRPLLWQWTLRLRQLLLARLSVG